MIQETLRRIEEKIEKGNTIKKENKTELLNLISKLKSEIQDLSEMDADRARSIAGFTEITTHEAIREEKNPQLLKVSLEGLSLSVKALEASHPRLVRIVNSISVALSNLGI